MKCLIAAVLFIASSFAYGQGELHIIIELKDHQMKPMTGQQVVMEEVLSKDEVKATTNHLGFAEFNITTGTTWKIRVKDQKDERSYDVPPRGTRTVERSMVYTPAEHREVKLEPARRDGIVFQELPAVGNCTGPPDRGFSRIILKVSTMKEEPLAHYTFKLTCIKLKKTWTGRTDASGKVCFTVPPNHDYEVDVDDLKAYDQIDSRAMGFSSTLTLSYEPTNIAQNLRGDTIRQELYNNPSPTFTHTLMTITLRNPEGEKLAGEEICWDELDGPKVYAATTDEFGVAQFLLKKGKKYTLHFKYEREVSLLDMSKMGSISTGEGDYVYRGSKAIEDYYARTKRNEQGFITSFLESTIKPHRPDEPCEVTPTAHGYALQLPSTSAASTPAIDENRLLISGGRNTREFYCFDTQSGRFNWGVELSDGGASSAVVSEGVVLINTYSCTLYAIDAKTGKLLWAKWMGPIILTTPSVKDGKVYAVYPNDIDDGNDPEKQYVIACFDLKTGDLIWQGWLSGEGMSSPVIANENVYVTTLNGQLYAFEKEKGKLQSKLSNHFTSPPTIANDRIYISAKKSGNETQEEVCIYDAKTFKLIKKPRDLNGAFAAADLYDLRATASMNYNGSRMSFYKNKNYNVMGNKLICSNPADGAIVWSVTLPAAPTEEKSQQVAAMPVILDDKVIVNLNAGKVLVFDAANGKKLNEYSTGEKLWSQPSVDKGIIYAGTENGQVLTIDTKNKNLTGWPMWGMDAAHNPVQKP